MRLNDDPNHVLLQEALQAFIHPIFGVFPQSFLILFSLLPIVFDPFILKYLYKSLIVAKRCLSLAKKGVCQSMHNKAPSG